MVRYRMHSVGKIEAGEGPRDRGGEILQEKLRT